LVITTAVAIAMAITASTSRLVLTVWISDVAVEVSIAKARPKQWAEPLATIAAMGS
jgi:hypothetical protein